MLVNLYEKIFVPAQNKHVVFDLLTKIPMGRNLTLEFPRITPGQNFTAAYAAEASEKSTSKAQIDKVDLTLRTFYAMFYETKQFALHALSSAQELLLDKASHDILNEIENQIYGGTVPWTGFNTAITCCHDTSGSLDCPPCESGNLNYEDILLAANSVEQNGYFSNLSAIVTVRGWRDLRMQKDTYGQFVLHPLADGSGGAITAWGIKIYPSSNLTTTGLSAIVGDFSKALYADGGKINITPNELMAAAFNYNMIYYRLEIEAAFAILDTNAFCLVKHPCT